MGEPHHVARAGDPSAEPDGSLAIDRAAHQERREALVVATACGALLTIAVLGLWDRAGPPAAWIALALVPVVFLVVYALVRWFERPSRLLLHRDVVESIGPGGAHWAVPWTEVTGVRVVDSPLGRSVVLEGPALRLAAPRTFPLSNDPGFDAKVACVRTFWADRRPSVPDLVPATRAASR